MRFFILPLLACLLIGCGDTPPDDQAAQTPPPQVTFSHATSHQEAVPGQTLQLLWRFDMAPDWHLYGPGRNDSGFPPSVRLDLPDGWLAGPLQWPAPERYVMAGGILDHVYHGQLLLVQDLQVPASGAVGTQVDIPLQVDWLACKDACVPGQAKTSLKLTVAERTAPSAEFATIEKVLAAVPVPAPEGAPTMAWVELEVADATGLAFYPDQDCLALADLVRDGEVDSGRLKLELGKAVEGQTRLKGILKQQLSGGTTRHWTINIQPGG